MTDEKKPPQGAVQQQGEGVGRFDLVRLVEAQGRVDAALWVAVRAARGAGQLALMAELEALAITHEALIARVQPSIVFKQS